MSTWTTDINPEAIHDTKVPIISIELFMIGIIFDVMLSPTAVREGFSFLFSQGTIVTNVTMTRHSFIS